MSQSVTPSSRGILLRWLPARNEDNGNRVVRARQLALQVKPAQLRHTYIEDQTRRSVGITPTKES
jgi:hypothetical protein